MKYMKIKEALVLQGYHGLDEVTLKMDGVTAPMAFYPEERNFRVTCDGGKGVDWVKENFPGIPIEVVDYPKRAKWPHKA